MLIEGFLQHIANKSLTHIGPERATLVLGKDQFMNLILRKCVIL